MQNTLIVEDIPEVAEFLALRVQQVFPAAQIHKAASLQQARTSLQQGIPELLLLDLGLPDGSGLDLLLDKQSLSNCCVVITTIFDDDEHLFNALRLGAQGYLLKDEPEENLVQALQGITRGQPPLSAAVAQRILSSFQPAPCSGHLSPREEEVLLLLAKGYSNREAASALQLTTNTVAGYIKDIYRKLQINSRAEAATEAIRRGLLRQ